MIAKPKFSPEINGVGGPQVLESLSLGGENSIKLMIAAASLMTQTSQNSAEQQLRDYGMSQTLRFQKIGNLRQIFRFSSKRQIQPSIYYDLSVFKISVVDGVHQGG
jgi:hypothetical protein